MNGYSDEKVLGWQPSTKGGERTTTPIHETRKDASMEEGIGCNDLIIISQVYVREDVSFRPPCESPKIVVRAICSRRFMVL